jgi:hypothetical protein
MIHRTGKRASHKHRKYGMDKAANESDNKEESEAQVEKEQVIIFIVKPMIRGANRMAL